MRSKKQLIPICFDLDHTLLDTLQIRKDIFTLASPYGAHRARLIQAYRGAVGEKFTPSKFVARLGIAKSCQHELLKKIWIPLSATRRFYVYQGVFHLLGLLQKLAPLYLVTHGDDSYQRVKFQQSGLAHYFSRVIVTPQISKEQILRRLYRETEGRILLIDDSRRVLNSAKKIGFPMIKVRKDWKDEAYIASLTKKIIKRLQSL
jgi:FMN phosphatase YigB (HAD superfamily)